MHTLLASQFRPSLNPVRHSIISIKSTLQISGPQTKSLSRSCHQRTLSCRRGRIYNLSATFKDLVQVPRRVGVTLCSVTQPPLEHPTTDSPCFISFEAILTHRAECRPSPYQRRRHAYALIDDLSVVPQTFSKSRLQTPRHAGYSDNVPNMQSIVYVRSFLALTQMPAHSPPKTQRNKTQNSITCCDFSLPPKPLSASDRSLNSSP